MWQGKSSNRKCILKSGGGGGGAWHDLRTIILSHMLHQTVEIVKPVVLSHQTVETVALLECHTCYQTRIWSDGATARQFLQFAMPVCGHSLCS